MKMDLIQPFISSLDAVLAEMTRTPITVADLAMDGEGSGYRRKGLAAIVSFRGEIDGRVVLDMAPPVAAKIAGFLTGDEVDPREPIVPETICELANMVIGNAVTQLNDRGFQFKVSPPEVLSEEECVRMGRDSEATVLSFETPEGAVHLNIAMHYQARFGERPPVFV